ncbi:MAG: hypothetical protein JO283_11640 [Bradyrhizobium sp.]|nr:hypothetical protein [Bradyrhizobium sp.]
MGATARAVAVFGCLARDTVRQAIVRADLAQLKRGWVVLGAPKLAASIIHQAIQAKMAGVDVVLIDDFSAANSPRLITGEVDYAVIPSGRTTV